MQELVPYPTLNPTINSKWIKGLNLRLETMKVLQEK